MEFEYEPGRFFKNDSNNKLIGEICYTLLDDHKTISIDHTFVNPDYRGQGIARQLLQKTIDLAKEKGWKILPVCPYARKVFEAEPSLKPLLNVSNK